MPKVVNIRKRKAKSDTRDYKIKVFLAKLFILNSLTSLRE